MGPIAVFKMLLAILLFTFLTTVESSPPNSYQGIPLYLDVEGHEYCLTINSAPGSNSSSYCLPPTKQKYCSKASWKKLKKVWEGNGPDCPKYLDVKNYQKCLIDLVKPGGQADVDFCFPTSKTNGCPKRVWKKLKKAYLGQNEEDYGPPRAGSFAPDDVVDYGPQLADDLEPYNYTDNGLPPPDFLEPDNYTDFGPPLADFLEPDNFTDYELPPEYDFEGSGFELDYNIDDAPPPAGSFPPPAGALPPGAFSVSDESPDLFPPDVAPPGATFSDEPPLAGSFGAPLPGAQRPRVPGVPGSKCTATTERGRTKECKFPFTYTHQGRTETYWECTTVNSNQPWCAYKVNRNGVAISGKWADCDPGCPGV